MNARDAHTMSSLEGLKVGSDDDSDGDLVSDEGEQHGSAQRYAQGGGGIRADARQLNMAYGSDRDGLYGSDRDDPLQGDVADGEKDELYGSSDDEVYDPGQDRQPFSFHQQHADVGNDGDDELYDGNHKQAGAEMEEEMDKNVQAQLSKWLSGMPTCRSAIPVESECISLRLHQTPWPIHRDDKKGIGERLTIRWDRGGWRICSLHD